jgi:hypothetical protein
MDLFMFGYWFLLYLGCRRVLRLNATGAAVATALVAFLTVGLPALLAK